jgi:adenosine tuberculosinyltransferase
MISIEEFLELSATEVADLVRASGSKVIVFPINGTRRWFMLEHGHKNFDDPIAAYMDISGKRHIEIYKLFFDHGIETLITPVIGSEILQTRDAYMQKVGEEGLRRLVSHPDFISFYEQYNVRVHFYGDYHKKLAQTPYQHLPKLFDDVATQTSQNKSFRLFFGAFAESLDITEHIANYAVEHYKSHGELPKRKEIVEMYYGENIEKADIFIGFDRFATFDYPLLNSGEEDLYFTVSPSMYMTVSQLRKILYDHLYMRRTPEPEYTELSNQAFEFMHLFYEQHKESTFGFGSINANIWYPSFPSSERD